MPTETPPVVRAELDNGQNLAKLLSLLAEIMESSRKLVQNIHELEMLQQSGKDEEGNTMTATEAENLDVTIAELEADLHRNNVNAKAIRARIAELVALAIQTFNAYVLQNFATLRYYKGIHPK